MSKHRRLGAARCAVEGAGTEEAVGAAPAVVDSPSVFAAPGTSRNDRRLGGGRPNICRSWGNDDPGLGALRGGLNHGTIAYVEGHVAGTAPAVSNTTTSPGLISLIVIG